MKSFKKWLDESVTISGGGVRGMGYVSGAGDGDSPNYLSANVADAETRNNIMNLMKTQHLNMHKSTKSTKVSK